MLSRANALGCLLVFAFCLGSIHSSAQFLDSGHREGAAGVEQTVGHPTSSSARILYFSQRSQAGLQVSALQDAGFDVTRSSRTAELSLTNLINYEVLVISLTGPGVLTAVAEDIAAFVGSGRGLLVHQPGVVGQVDYVPAGFEIEIAGSDWCNRRSGTDLGDWKACIVDGTHPVTAGVRDDELGADLDLVGTLGPGFVVLAENCVCGDPAIAAGTYGAGVIVLDTTNFATDSLKPPSPDALNALFGHLGDSARVSNQPVSIGKIKIRFQ